MRQDRMMIAVLVVASSVANYACAVDPLTRVDLTYDAEDGALGIDSRESVLSLLHMDTAFDFFVGPKPAEYSDVLHNFSARHVGSTPLLNLYDGLQFPAGTVATGYSDVDLDAGLEVDAYVGVHPADAWCLNGKYCHWTLVAGDFNEDNQTDQADIDELSVVVRTHSGPLAAELRGYDLDFDGVLSTADRQVWLSSVRQSHYGDANLDGRFDAADLVIVFQGGQYLDDVVGNSTWKSGDWDGDAEFSTSDLVIAFQEGGYEAATQAKAAIVPEPDSSSILLAVAMMLVACIRNKTAGTIQRMFPGVAGGFSA